MRNTRDPQPLLRKPFRQIKTGRVTFHIRAQRHHQLTYSFGRDPPFQFRNTQILGFNSIERRKLAPEHVVFAAKCPGLFHAQDVDGPFDDADQGGIPSRIATNVAGSMGGQGAAGVAQTNLIARLQYRVGKVLDGARFGLNQVQSDPLGRAWPNSGQLAERANQLSDLFRQYGQWDDAAGKSSDQRTRRCLTQPRQIEACRYLAHFGVGDFFGLTEGLVGGGEHHVFEELGISRVDRLRINFNSGETAVAFGCYFHRSTAAGRFDSPAGEVFLDFLHLLLHVRSLFHEFADAGHKNQGFALGGDQARTSTIRPLKTSSAF